MNGGMIVGDLDVTELLWWAFVLFFVSLIFYLRREDRREGYPTEDEVTGVVDTPGGYLSRADEKIFKLPHGQGTRTPGQGDREAVDLPATRTFKAAGAPYKPTGDTFQSNIGPGSWAERDKLPDLDWEGHPRIVPMTSAPEISIAPRDPDPRGYTVVGNDGVAAGTVDEIWVDRGERVLRYLSVKLNDGTGSVLVPMPMSRVNSRGKSIIVHAVNGAHFAGAPRLSAADTITRYEEERIVAYYGGGYLYADRAREEAKI